MTVTVAVITCSTRSAAGLRPDGSGPLLVNGLREAGFAAIGPVLVPDDIEAISAAVTGAVADGAQIVLTTGGTGLSPTDVTPEAVRPLLEREVPGIAEAIRAVSRASVPTSMLSRGVAGVVGHALVVTLPGSPGGARDGLAVLLPILEHAISQLGGGDH